MVLPAYDQVLKCSHIFNLLDSRGAISVTERVGVIGRVRKLALGVADSLDGEIAPKTRRPREPAVSARNRNRRDPRLDDRSCIEQFAGYVSSIARSACSGREGQSSVDATPRRLGPAEPTDCSNARPMSKSWCWVRRNRPGAGAAAGFAKKMGTTPDQLGTAQHPQGRILSAFTKRTQGQPTATMLARELPQLILKIQWPKTMVWNGKGTERFIRPIRWLVALLGDAVVPFEIGGVDIRQHDASATASSGSRRSRSRSRTSSSSYEPTASFFRPTSAATRSKPAYRCASSPTRICSIP